MFKLQVFVLLLLAACRAPSSRWAPSGRWTLVSIDGAEVPTFIAPTPGDTLWVYEGSMDFPGGDTAFRAERTMGWRQGDPGRKTFWHYRATGDSVMLWYDCPPMTICPGEELGVLTRDSLVVRSSRFGGVRLLYRPVLRMNR